LYDTLLNTSIVRLQGNRFDIIDHKICGTIPDPTEPFSETHDRKLVPHIPNPEIQLPAYDSFFERRAIRVGVRNNTIYAQFRTNARDRFIEKEFVTISLFTLEGYSEWSTFLGFTSGFVADGPDVYTLTGSYANGIVFEMRFDINDANNFLKLSFRLTNPPPKTFGDGPSFSFAMSQMARAAITSNGLQPDCYFLPDLGDGEDASIIIPEEGSVLYSDCRGDLGRFSTTLVADESAPGAFGIQYTYNTHSFNVSLAFEGVATYDEKPVYVNSPQSITFFSGVELGDWATVALNRRRVMNPIQPDNQVRLKHEIVAVSPLPTSLNFFCLFCFFFSKKYLGVLLRLRAAKFDNYYLYDPSIQLLDLFTDLPEDPLPSNMGWIAAVAIGDAAVAALGSLAIPQVRAKLLPFFSRSNEVHHQILTHNNDEVAGGGPAGQWSVARPSPMESR
jgi:hypothetical protein